MGVRDLIRATADLAFFMYKGSVEDSSRELGALKASVPEDLREELKEQFETLEGYIREARWDEAYALMLSLIEAITRQMEDPPVSIWLPRETYERFEEVAEAVKEPKSKLGREILTGETGPVSVDQYQKRIEEAMKPVKADWEVGIEEAMKPATPEHERRLKEYEGQARGTKSKSHSYERSSSSREELEEWWRQLLKE